MSKCTVPGCKSSITEPKRRTFPFPEIPARRQEWMNIILKEHPGFKLTKYPRICYYHFSPEDLEKYHRLDGKLTNIPLAQPKLNKEAVPTVFPGKPHPPIPSQLILKRPPPSNNIKLFDEIFLESTDFEVQYDLGKNPIQIVVEKISSDDFLLCRICESTEELIDISTESNAHFREKLRQISCLSDGPRDDLLKFICCSCGERLEDLSTFRAQCEITYRKLLGEVVQEEENPKDLKVEDETFQGLIEDKEMSREDSAEVISQRSSPTESLFAPTNESLQEVNGESVRHDSKDASDQTRCDIKTGIVENSENGKKRKRRKGLNLHCPICDITLKNTYQLIRHRMRHKGEVLTCELCGIAYSCTVNLKRHIRTVHERRKDYVCHMCDKMYSQSNDLKIHIKKHHNQNDPPDQITRNYDCDVCGKSFKTQYFLKIHKNIHLTLEERLAKRKEARTESAPKKKMCFICPICGKISGSLNVNICHMRIHTGEKPFTCSHCSKAFRNYQEMKVHLRIHTDDRPYKCTACNAGFRQNAHLKCHMLQHTGEKPFKCQVCERTFRVNANLIAHMRLHTGEKPFHCSHCPEKFHNARVLRQHNRKNHSGDQDTPQGKSEFQQSSDLVQDDEESMENESN